MSNSAEDEVVNCSESFDTSDAASSERSGAAEEEEAAAAAASAAWSTTGSEAGAKESVGGVAGGLDEDPQGFMALGTYEAGFHQDALRNCWWWKRGMERAAAMVGAPILEPRMVPVWTMRDDEWRLKAVPLPLPLRFR